VGRHHDERLGALRERVEKAIASPHGWGTLPVAVRRAIPVAVGAGAAGRTPEISVVVRRKWPTADGVMAFELEPVTGELPTVQPGAHVDVHLPNGLVRQYSLTNGPGEQERYRIGVKLEPASQGGSTCLHHAVSEGDVLAISRPHSNFTLRRDAVRTVLLAGGIGVTPLLAMAQALANSERGYELHVFAQSAAHLAFAEILDQLGDAVVTHLGLDPAATLAEMESILGPFRTLSQLYVCGPAPMLEAARAIATRLDWPDETVHFEYFKNTRVLDDHSSFEVELARSGFTVVVPAGRSILEVVREHGVSVPSSCEQGACGSCVVTVLGGRPDHQDVYLRESEHARGDRMTVCVSRSASPRLVLDL
jgi:ferredoxin-NADP reductase